MEKQFYTLREIHDIEGINLKTLWKNVHQGVLKATKEGRNYLVFREDLLEYLSKKRAFRDTPPERKIDCIHYMTCLTKAAKKNYNLYCSPCKKFSTNHIVDRENLKYGGIS